MNDLLGRIAELEKLTEEKLLEKKYDTERSLRKLLGEKKAIIAVEGNIGLGKSTVIRTLENLGVLPLYELEDSGVSDNGFNVDINELLQNYYSDKKRYAYQLQMVFFKRRADQIKHAYEIVSSAKILEREKLISPSSVGSVGLDRTIYADRVVFSEVLHDEGNFPEWEYRQYIDYFDSKIKELPKPDLLVMLKGSPTFALERIRRRERGFESIETEEKGTGISLEFMSHLHEKFEGFESFIRDRGYFSGQMITLDREKMNPVTNMSNYVTFLELVGEKLNGR
jgi:deoxyadenosine/deoxycytidine kinase